MSIKFLLKAGTITFLFLIAVAFVIYKYCEYRSEDGRRKFINHKTIKTNGNEWGYEIYVNNKLFIRQSQIPCLEGKSGFVNRQDAESVAKMVEGKVRNGKIPTVSIEELKELEVIH